MLAKTEEPKSVVKATLAAEPSNSRQIIGLIRYLLDNGLLRSPVLAFAVLSSMSKAAMIFSINQAAANPGIHASILLMLALSVGCTLVFSHLARISNQAVLEKIQYTLRTTFTERLLDADVGFLQGQDHGQMYSIVAKETKEVSSSSVRLVEMFEAAVLILFTAPYLFWMSWLTGVATLVTVAIGALGFILTDGPARRLVLNSNRATAEFSDRINDMLGGWMELRLRRSRRVALEQHAVSLATEAHANSTAAERLFSLGQITIQASMIALLCAIVVFLPLVQGFGTAVMFQMLTLVLFTSGPIETLFSGLPRLSRAAASKQQIDESLRNLARNRERSRPSTGRPRDQFETIELRDVTAVLGDGGRPAVGGSKEDIFELGPINLTFRPGEVVFICGGNGAGKSTLMSLITGLRSPDSGEILLDGRPVTTSFGGEYRSLFSAVFSHFHLFRQPYGLGHEEKLLVRLLLDDFGLSERVSLGDGSFSTLSLSTGQRRRLALAVALAERRPIIVLDEFAADQDPQRRAFFYDELVPELAKLGHLVLVVTHDEHRFAQCDRLIRMDAGKIVSDTRRVPAAPPTPPIGAQRRLPRTDVGPFS